MKLYLVSLATGVLVGVVYAVLNVRSPAPPVVALIGLLGMLIGEQVVPIARRLISGQPVDAAWVSTECVPRLLGTPPARAAQSVTPPPPSGTPPA